MRDATAVILMPFVSLAIFVAVILAAMGVSDLLPTLAGVDAMRVWLADVLINLGLPVMTDGHGRFVEVIR